MKKLHEDPRKYYNPKERPSGHDIGSGFAKDNGGAIPPTLEIPNSESNSSYIQLCKAVSTPVHLLDFPRNFQNFLSIFNRARR